MRPIKKQDDISVEVIKKGTKGTVKSTNELGFYEVRNLIDAFPDAYYYMLIGERANGKSFSVLDYIVEMYFKTKKKSVLIRRILEQVKKNKMEKVFENLEINKNTNRISELSGGKFNHIVYRGRNFYFANKKEDSSVVVSPEPFAFASDISTSINDKSLSYPDVGYIVFDEFLVKENAYSLNDEFVKFCNALSTIIRLRDDIKVFMIGNTVNKYSPYFKEMGLTNIKSLEKGDVQVYTYGHSKLKVVVQFTDSPTFEKKSNVYFAFGNQSLRMITSGDWELGFFPHCPDGYKILPKDIKFKFYIEFEEELFQGNIVKKDEDLFLFIHEKTTPLKELKNDVVFSQVPSTNKNYRMLINRPTDRIGKIIWKMFVDEKVFYSNNSVGNAIDCYISWCSGKRRF